MPHSLDPCQTIRISECGSFPDAGSEAQRTPETQRRSSGHAFSTRQRCSSEPGILRRAAEAPWERLTFPLCTAWPGRLASSAPTRSCPAAGKRERSSDLNRTNKRMLLGDLHELLYNSFTISRYNRDLTFRSPLLAELRNGNVISRYNCSWIW